MNRSIKQDSAAATEDTAPIDADTRSAPPAALSGMRVLDLSRVLAGPLCAQVLGDLGADVIKVESPAGDETRRLGKPGEEGSAPYFMGLNRNKKGIVLNFDNETDRTRLHALIEQSDVLIENFLQGSMARWGFDYETVLAPRQPALIYANISGFGWAGPLSGLPGYDAVAQALTGIMAINGHDETGPTRVGVPLCDITTGLYAAIGILAAWTFRKQTGLGQRVDANLYASGLALMHPHAANWWMQAINPGLSGNAHPNIAPYESFMIRGERIFIGVVNNGQFAKLCRFLALHALIDDPRFLDPSQRVAHRGLLHQIISDALSARWHPMLWRELMLAGVPAGMVHSIPQAFTAEQTQALGLVPREGFFGTPFPVMLSRTPGREQLPAPKLDASKKEFEP